jgi:hypothetical protein
VEEPEIVDQHGQVQDWAWLVANFGDVRLERADASEEVTRVYRIVRLEDSEGPATQIVNVVDEEEVPLGGIHVVRHWPDAPQLPDWPPPVSRWRDRGVYGTTNARGDIGFGMGHGDYYFPPDGGASAIWVADADGPADLLSGLGMLGGTDHRHLNVYYQLQDVAESTPPPPPEDEWSRLLQKLDRIIALLEQFVGQ